MALGGGKLEENAKKSKSKSDQIRDMKRERVSLPSSKSVVHVCRENENNAAR